MPVLEPDPRYVIKGTPASALRLKLGKLPLSAYVLKWGVFKGFQRIDNTITRRGAGRSARWFSRRYGWQVEIRENRIGP